MMNSAFKINLELMMMKLTFKKKKGQRNMIRIHQIIPLRRKANKKKGPHTPRQRCAG